MNVDLVNAAPMVVDLGTRDLSTRVVPLSPLDIPQHLPKLYLFAEQGPVGPTYVDFSSVSLTQLYGADTFDVNKKYYTHQTPYVQAIAAAGNNCVIHRLTGTGANDVANIAMYLDVLPTQLPLYEKNIDGSIATDINGMPVQVYSGGLPVTVSGFKVAWIVDKTIAPIGTYTPGLLTVRNGLQVNGTVQSTQYPIFELAASSPGEYGNKLAIRMYAGLQSDIAPFPSNVLSEGKMYPYYFQMVKLADQLTGKVSDVLNSFGSKYSKFVNKNLGTDPASGAVISFDKVIADQYINLTPDLQTGLGIAHTYVDNLNTIITSLYNTEKTNFDVYRDPEINVTEMNIYAFNIMSFVSSNGSPYSSIEVVDLNGSVRLTKNTNLFLSGGLEGATGEIMLDTLVSDDMKNYNNNLHEYNDIVAHPESMVYDSGFTLETKKDLMNFISRRKDTFVTLSTYAHDAPSVTLSDQYSVGVALKTMIDLYPESSYWGTPVMRGVIMAGSGELINSLYTNKVSLAYEVAYKSANYMGAKNGAWKNGFCFDRAPLSVITQLKNIDVTWVPTSTRNTLWATGINFALNYKIKTQFFPAIQTVYSDDTSVLNSYFTAVAISYLNKVAHSAWREFSGSISLTNAQLEEQVNSYVSNLVKDKFDNKFVIVPNATVTELDNIRGFSWTLPIKLYSPGMKSVMTTYIEANRMDALVA